MVENYVFRWLAMDVQLHHIEDDAGGLVRLDVVHTQGPGLVAVVHVLILDHGHIHVLVVKVQEDIQSQPVVQDHRCEFFKNVCGKNL
jgi:hypothetical protein